MKKVLLFLANGFEMYEASVFIDVLGWNNTYGSQDTPLTTCGFTKTVVSTFGIPVVVDKLIDELDIEEYQALAIPGGFETYGFYNDAFHEQFMKIINEFNRNSRTVASICVGALPVAKSGILTNRNATTYHLSDGRRQKQLQEFGVNLINEPVVVDNNVITSWAPSTALDVAYRLLENLTGVENCSRIKEIMGF